MTNRSTTMPGKMTRTEADHGVSQKTPWWCEVIFVCAERVSANSNSKWWARMGF